MDNQPLIAQAVYLATLDAHTQVSQLQAKLDKAVAEVINLLNCYNGCENGKDVRFRARQTLTEIKETTNG